MIATAGRVSALLIGLPFVLAAAGWGAFSAVGWLAQTSEHHEVSYQWNGGDISVHLSAGDVHVVAGSGSQVNVAYTEHYQLKKPTVTASSTGGGVQLNAKCPGGIFGNNCQINYTITVPAAAKLVVHTGDGGIDVADSTGDLALDTGGGGITIDNVSGAVTARTGDGGINGRAVRSTSVQATTGGGGVSLAFDIVPKAVNVRTGGGGIDIAVPDGSGPYNVSASTGAGGTDIKVPTDPKASPTITAHTGNGGIAVKYAGS